MNISADSYNIINGPQFRDAQELLQQIKQEVLDKNENVGLIVEVGCGSGNVTQIMADFIPHERILSFDIAPEMVEASRNLLSSKSSLEFFVQDISQPWDKLDRKLREVEGQVDLVWSNRVLHWVNDSLRPIAASNILRLLRPGGRVYLNVTQIPNFNETLPAEEKERNEKLLRIPSRQEQQQRWTDCFKNAGLEKLNVEYFAKFWQYEDNSVFEISKDCVHLNATYLPLDLDGEEKRRILEGIQDLAVRSWAAPLGTKLVEKIEGHHTKSYYGQFRITGQKQCVN